MRAKVNEVSEHKLLSAVRSALKLSEHRIATMTSIDGRQLLTVMLNLQKGSADCWVSPLEHDEYQSLTPQIPQMHWCEREIAEMFGLKPVGHPRLKPVNMHECYDHFFAPLRARPVCIDPRQPRDFAFMTVSGEGVYEIPVGPVHAGIIEPGHFRLSCMGEVIVNLELRLGFSHRGVEKRLTEVPWTHSRFVAEAIASDTAAANALAHCIAIESLLEIEPSLKAQSLRSLCLETERVAMHIGDIGGMLVDLGLLGLSATLSRLRGSALRMGELLTNSRYLRGFICPGGVWFDPTDRLVELQQTVKELSKQLEAPLAIFHENQAVYERLHGTGVLTNNLARDFGLVGIAARGSGIAYDTRAHFKEGALYSAPVEVVSETAGDALARVLVRIKELRISLSLMETLLESIPGGLHRIEIPETLAPSQIGIGVVESFRGELLHMIITDEQGKIKRYCIKDPSFNNWTGLAIAVRNNVVADFPVCNKSFSLSYSGHDL
jgi:Ni,Fe-hydrogenase III large subunit/Ni,Fe-hydrogenase III component G